MKKSTIYSIIWSAWLGGCLGYLGYGMFSWQFWVIFIPVSVFTTLEKDAKANEE